MSDGLLDTNILIHFPNLHRSELPTRAAISTVTVAELSHGIHATNDPVERMKRTESLEWALSRFDAIPFDIDIARLYGRITAAVASTGRSPRSRVADQMIAATAASRGWPLYTTNPTDFLGLEKILTVVPVALPQLSHQPAITADRPGDLTPRRRLR
jgi:predicted nucleic acid-binding protein